MVCLRSALDAAIALGLVLAANASASAATPLQSASHPASPRNFVRRHRDSLVPTSASSQLARRGADSINATFTSLWYASSYTEGAPAPESIEGDSPGQTVIIGGLNGTDNNSPVSSCPIAFIGGSAVEGQAATGWQAKAQVVDFDILELPLDDEAVLPYYLERKDVSKIKRVVIVLQGAPRDSWRYANLVRYSGLCAVSNSNYDVNFQDYAVAAPLLWNTLDRDAGGASPNQAVWRGLGWAYGNSTVEPAGVSYTSWKAMDVLVSSFFNQTAYPALTSVVIAGHSAGAMMVQRYAMLRDMVDGEDENMKWWSGNAGSYVWPVDSRPVPNPVTASTCKSGRCDVTPECATRMNQWPYGINATDLSSMNVYARSRFEAGDKDKILRTYLDRRFLYALAVDDDGPGDTHCQAQYQGDSHITRGRNLAAVLGTLDAPNHVVSYVDNATHVDEEMYIDFATQSWLFNEGINDARNLSRSSTESSNGGSRTSSGSDSTSTSSSNPSAATKIALDSFSKLLAAFTTLAVVILGVWTI